MKPLKRIITFVAAVSVAVMASAVKFCDHGSASRFMEVEIHAMFGGTGLLNNYAGNFSEIRESTSSMGKGWGVGATAEFGLSNFFAFGTQINMIVSNSSLDMAVSNAEATTSSNIFLRNRAYYLNFPVYASFRFNLAQKIRWNIDGGLYYSYGFGGSQKQTIYHSSVNELGDLVNRVVTAKPSFFNNGQTFINSFYRGDIGLHLATGLTFNARWHLGLMSQIGFKNISHTTGLKNPRIHNLNVMMTLGYRF